MNVNDFSNEVVQNMDGPGAKFLDPITLSILIAIISAIVQHVFTKCLDKVDPVSVKSPNLLQRIKLRRQVRQQFQDSAPHLTDIYADKVYDSILKTSSGKSDDTIHQVVMGFNPE